MTNERAHGLVWEEWVQQHGARLMLYARQMLRSEQDAEEVVQDAFVRLWKSGEWRNPGTNIGALLFVISRRLALDKLKMRRRRCAHEEAAADPAEFPDMALFDSASGTREEHEELARALARLPEEQREVVTMKVWGDMTFNQIAEAQGLSINTVAARYRYALQALKKILAGSSEAQALECCHAGT